MSDLKSKMLSLHLSRWALLFSQLALLNEKKEKSAQRPQ